MSEPTSRICTMCRVEKPLDEFYIRTRGPYGRTSRCKPCCLVANLRSLHADPARVERMRARTAAWHRQRKYGLDEDAFRAMHDEQNGVCAICERREKLVVDHDHATGKVRGLLCHSCNMTLGRAEDDTERLRRMIDYLEAHALLEVGA